MGHMYSHLTDPNTLIWKAPKNILTDIQRYLTKFSRALQNIHIRVVVVILGMSANLRRANLTGVDFTEAKVKDADLRGTGL